MREQFEMLFNDLGNASYVLAVMAKGAENNAAWMELEPSRIAHNEMGFALEFMAEVVKEKVNTLYGLLEDLEPEEEDEDEEESEGGGRLIDAIDSADEPPAARTEEDILSLFRQLDNGAKSDLYGYALGLLYGGAAARK